MNQVIPNTHQYTLYGLKLELEKLEEDKMVALHTVIGFYMQNLARNSNATTTLLESKEIAAYKDKVFIRMNPNVPAEVKYYGWTPGPQGSGLPAFTYAPFKGNPEDGLSRKLALGTKLSALETFEYATPIHSNPRHFMAPDLFYKNFSPISQFVKVPTLAALYALKSEFLSESRRNTAIYSAIDSVSLFKPLRNIVIEYSAEPALTAEQVAYITAIKRDRVGTINLTLVDLTALLKMHPKCEETPTPKPS